MNTQQTPKQLYQQLRKQCKDVSFIPPDLIANKTLSKHQIHEKIIANYSQSQQDELIENMDTENKIAKYIQEITPGLRRMNKHINTANTHFGYLTLPQMTMTLALPNDGFLILINEGTFTFLYSLAKAITSYFVEVNPESETINFQMSKDMLQKRLDESQKGIQHFGVTLLTQMLIGNAKFASSFPLNEAKTELAKALSESAQRCLIALQLVYIQTYQSEIKTVPQEQSFLQRLFKRKPEVETTPTTTLLQDRILCGKFNVQELVKTLEKEEKIDDFLGQASVLTISNIITTTSPRLSDPAIAYSGIEFFLAVLDIVEEIQGLGETERKTRTHSRNEGTKLFAMTFGQSYSNMSALGELIYWLTHEIWLRSKDNFYKNAQKLMDGIEASD